MCNCIEDVNKELQKINVELVVPFMLKQNKVSRMSLALRKKYDAPRGTKVPTIICAYCPICGEEYIDVPEEEAADDGKSDSE